MSLETGGAASAESSSVSPSTSTGAASTSAAPAQTSAASTSSPQTATPQTSAASTVIAPGGQSPWSPNFKFKAAGKEHEIPEYLRGAMKDATTEKQLIELHEKAYGLDLVKNNYQSAQTQLQHIQKNIMPDYQNLRGTVDSVLKFREAGDLDSVLETVGIKPEAVAQWMLKRLELQDMTPQQKAVHENEQRLRKENYALQDRMQSLSQSHEQTQLQVRAVELQTVLAKPDVQTVADSYNTRMGQPDAFWNFVCQQADFMERSSGQRISAEQAIQRVVQILGNTAPQTPVASTPAPQPTPPIIPNIAGASNTSPTRKVAKSLDDLRKLHKEMASQR